MKHMLTTALLSGLLLACSHDSKNIIADNFKFASQQLPVLVAEADSIMQQQGNKVKFSPRTLNPDGSLELVASKDWTSGFFPGSLWYMYQYTKDNKWKDLAQRFTMMVEPEQYNGVTHDMGFKMYCSFGNGYRLTHDSTYRDILIQSARTLSTRFKPTAGIIRSWDHNKDKWQCPVIIDNMLNLELLYWAAKETKDTTFSHIATTHARTTLKNHFRPDNSCYHVVDYDTITGQVLHKHTHQGYAHESAWARGQAWALYGYTMCYRETGDTSFLAQAQRVAAYIFNHPRLPSDLIPYWDFDAPDIPNAPRDMSAAAVIASALYELATYQAPTDSVRYKGWADTIVQNATAHYRAPLGQYKGFLLLHATGNYPKNSEIDMPISYADYYFLEALLRKQALEQ